MLFIYNENRVTDGCWDLYRGYNSNDNTIGYQLRTNNSTMSASDTGYRYRLWLTSADDTKWVPINTSSSTNATTARTLNTRAINPFGPIVYNSYNGTTSSGNGVGSTTIWQQYNFTIGYSYVLSLTQYKPVYLQCTPQTDGSAVMNVLTQTLPTTADGKIYIYLGIASSSTAMELRAEHPVYYYADGAIRLWTNAKSAGSSVEPATATPVMDGTAAVGISAKYAREDHVHPSDTNKQDTLISGTNIKTINGNSILGNGNLDISSGSSGVSIMTVTVTITSSNWNAVNNTCTKTVLGVKSDNDVIISCDPSYKDVYTKCDIYCSAQGTDSLTFKCSTVPTQGLVVNIMIIDGGRSNMAGTWIFNQSLVITSANEWNIDFTHQQGGTTTTHTSLNTVSGRNGYDLEFGPPNSMTAYMGQTDSWLTTKTIIITGGADINSQSFKDFMELNASKQ